MYKEILKGLDDWDYVYIWCKDPDTDPIYSYSYEDESDTLFEPEEYKVLVEYGYVKDLREII